MHEKTSQKKKFLRHTLGVHGNLRPWIQLLQDMCPYRLPIGTSPTPLRKLSKGPTVLAHRVGNPPESGARKAEQCKKKPGKNLARCFSLCFMHLHAISSTPMHSPSDFMRNRIFHVKVAGKWCQKRRTMQEKTRKKMLPDVFFECFMHLHCLLSTAPRPRG